MRRAAAALAALLILAGCESSTYKRARVIENVRDLAKREYNLDVEVRTAGETLGVRFRVPNLLGEMGAEDQRVWRQMDDLMLVLSRVVLSIDVPPEFFVLDIADAENPNVRMVFTRNVIDIRKIMADAISREQYLDRLLIDFVIGERRVAFDAQEMDLVRLMMMSMEAAAAPKPEDFEFRLAPVRMESFLANVIANHARRVLREKKEMKRQFVLRQVTGDFDGEEGGGGRFRVLLDLVASGRNRIPAGFLESRVLPFVVEESMAIFKSYKFTGFNHMMVVERNSGKTVTVPRG